MWSRSSKKRPAEHLCGPGYRPQPRRFFARPLEAPLSPHGRARGASASRRDPGTSSHGSARRVFRGGARAWDFAFRPATTSGPVAKAPCLALAVSARRHPRALTIAPPRCRIAAKVTEASRRPMVVIASPHAPAVYALWHRPSLEPRSQGASERSPGFVLTVGSGAGGVAVAARRRRLADRAFGFTAERCRVWRDCCLSARWSSLRQHNGQSGPSAVGEKGGRERGEERR